MKLKLFSTKRQIRRYLSEFDNSVLDKCSTIGEFFQNIIVVPQKKMIDKEFRKIYLFKAIQEIDISKLGFKKEFLSFAKNSEFIFGFLRELFLEKVDIDNVVLADTYLEFEEHLEIIKKTKQKYKELLEKDGYTDNFLIDKYGINSKLLDGIDKIEIFLDGYLSKFEIEVLDKIDKNIVVFLEVSKFNKDLVKKFLCELEDGYKYEIEYKTKTILSKQKSNPMPKASVSSFSKRFDEIGFVFAKIAEFVNNGIEAEKIAVVLPDETFCEFLEEMDEYKNLNFAMGKSFVRSELYIKLKSIYEYLTNKDELSLLKAQEWVDEFLKSDNIVEFVKKKASQKELELIDEELFKLSKFSKMFDEKKQFLYFVLEKLKKLSFDDNDGGKVTVMGVLEGRGIEWDGVIVVDFNDKFVPNANDKDLFLNSSIRKKAGLPMRYDKESLQKHYYYGLIKNAKMVAIGYVANETESVSKFAYELGVGLGKNEDKKYQDVLYKKSNPKNITTYDEKFNVLEPLTPTTLKTLLECPKKYYFSKILNIQNKEEGSNFGNIFHKALEKVVLNKQMIKNETEYYDAVMREIFNEMHSKKDIYDIRVKFEDSIKKFCQMDFEDMKYSTNMVEKWLEGVSVAGVRILCKVDRIDITQDKIVLIDYKTGNVDKLLKHPYDFQLTFYYLWAKQNYPNKQIEAIYWDIAQSKKVKTAYKVEQLIEALSDLPTKTTMAQDILWDDKIVKKWTDICKYCDYRIACGRDI